MKQSTVVIIVIALVLVIGVLAIPVLLYSHNDLAGFSQTTSTNTGTDFLSMSCSQLGTLINYDLNQTPTINVGDPFYQQAQALLQIYYGQGCEGLIR